MTKENKNYYLNADDMDANMYIVPIDNRGFSYNGLPFKVLAIDFPFVIAEAIYRAIPYTTFDVRSYKFKRTTEEYIKAHQDIENSYGKTDTTNVSKDTIGEFISGMFKDPKTGEFFDNFNEEKDNENQL